MKMKTSMNEGNDPMKRTMKTKINHLLGAVLLLLALPVATNAAIRVYDLTADFSAVQNPNCVWSYGWSESRGSTFYLTTTSGQADTTARL